MNILLILVPIITIIISATIAVKKRLSGVSAKKAFRYNAIAFLVVLTMLVVFAVGSFAAGSDSSDAAPAQTTTASEQAAETTGEEAQQSSTGFDKGMAYLAAGLSTGLAGIGGGIAVAAGAPAAIGAVSEDPKAFGKAIIFVALGESIALYGVVISILVLPR
ncbi:MAG: hypothetical protein IJI67_02865 [Clostridia bacterium]|nr:hypothetical protein [Clostridia bacterium]